jgi:predicted dehydrogenase
MTRTIGTLPRLGFVGVGWIGRNRLEALSRSRRAEIVAAADPAPVELDRVPCHASLDELLDHELDGIVIATPNAFHAEQSIAALERDLAVYCQKPLGRTAAEARHVVEAARDADRLLGVDLCYRHVEAFQKARSVVRAGAIGDVFAADLVFHNAYGPDKPWFYDPELSGGGCVLDLGVHLVDLALWTLGFPRVTKVSSRLFGVGEVEDYALAQLDLASGAVVRLACSWNLHAGQHAAIEATYYGARGSVSTRNVDGSFYDFRSELRYRTRADVLAEPPDDWGGRAITEWAERLGRGDRFDDRAEQYVTVEHVIDRIYRR